MGMKVGKEQAEHFRAVVAHYQCPPDEVELMKAAYERDPEGAAVCFAALAEHVARMADPPATGERVLNGEQFLHLGEVAREMEAKRT
jgi:hypothetical protein